MTPYSLAFVGLRLMSVWLFVQQLRAIPAVYISYRNWMSGNPLFGMSFFDYAISLMGFPGTIFVVSVVLWLGAPIIARQITDVEVVSFTAEESSSREWLAVGLTLVGAWVFLQSFSRVLALVLALYENSSVLSFKMNNEENLMQHWSSIIQLVLSTLLILKSYNVVRVLEASRRGFRDEVETNYDTV